MKNYYLYVGTYTGGYESDHRLTGSEGIYSYRMDPQSGKLSDRKSWGDHEIDPGFLAIQGNLLFGENERRDMGSVNSFRIESNGALIPIDRARAQGSKCAHLLVDRLGSYVFATNYAAGSVMVFRYAPDGKLTQTEHIQHYGSSVVPVRQACPRAHSTRQTPDGAGVVVPDLGIDKIMNYRFNRETGKLSPNPAQEFIEVDPGEGPRHFVFHPNGRFGYLVTEIGNHVYAYAFDGERQTLTQIQKISLLPDDFDGVSHSAEIIISRDGGYIYCSNRGHDTISGFRVDGESGKLTSIGHFPAGGVGPRHICFGPQENYIICANKDGNSITVMDRDMESGELQPAKYCYQIPAPSCVVWTAVDDGEE